MNSILNTNIKKYPNATYRSSLRLESETKMSRKTIQPIKNIIIHAANYLVVFVIFKRV